MHRIDTSGSVAGRFDDGNPATGQRATLLSADWFNDIQENVATVIETAGITLEKGNADQLKDAIAALVGDAALSLATLAELKAGTDTGKVVTAGALGSLFTADLDANGKLQFPGGMMIEWGSQALGSGSNVVSGTIAFHTAFVGACWHCFAQTDGPANGSWHPINVTTETPSLTGCAFTADTCNSSNSINAGRTIRWIAIGTCA